MITVNDPNQWLFPDKKKIVFDRTVNNLVSIDPQDYDVQKHMEIADSPMAAAVLGTTPKSEAEELEALKAARVWLHGSAEDKARYEELKAKL